MSDLSMPEEDSVEGCFDSTVRARSSCIPLDFILGEKITFSKKHQRLSPLHFFGLNFQNLIREFLEFRYGIKNDVMGPDDSKRLIDLSMFPTPKIASNLQLKHLNFNSVSTNIFLTEIRVHFIILDFILGEKISFWKKYQRLSLCTFLGEIFKITFVHFIWNSCVVSKTMRWCAGSRWW